MEVLGRAVLALAGLYALMGAMTAAAFGMAMRQAMRVDADAVRAAARDWAGSLLWSVALTGLIWPAFLLFMVRRESERSS